MKPSERIFEIARNLNHGTDATYTSSDMLIAAIMTYLNEEYEKDQSSLLAVEDRLEQKRKDFELKHGYPPFA